MNDNNPAPGNDTGMSDDVFNKLQECRDLILAAYEGLSKGNTGEARLTIAEALVALEESFHV